MKPSEFIALSTRDQAEFLLAFVFQMTISTRSVVHTNGESLTAQLISINELNHRYLSFIWKTLAGGTYDMYSGRDLIEMLQEAANRHDLRDEISNAWMGAERAFAMRHAGAMDERRKVGGRPAE